MGQALREPLETLPLPMRIAIPCLGMDGVRRMFTIAGMQQVDDSCP